MSRFLALVVFCQLSTGFLCAQGYHDAVYLVGGQALSSTSLYITGVNKLDCTGALTRVQHAFPGRGTHRTDSPWTWTTSTW